MLTQVLYVYLINDSMWLRIHTMIEGKFGVDNIQTVKMQVLKYSNCKHTGAHAQIFSAFSLNRNVREK